MPIFVQIGPEQTMTGALLGIDLGTSSVKVILVESRTGTELGVASASYPLRHPEPGAAEQLPEEWWQATVQAVRQVLHQTGHPAVAAIGLTGQMHGTVLLDSGGEPLGSAIIWADSRSADSAQCLTRQIGRERLLAISGSPLAAGFQAATIHWLRQHDPRRWQKSAMVLLPKDYLRFRLTGRFATDPSDAAATLLVDTTTRDWSPVLLEAVGINRQQLPDIVPSAAVSGLLAARAADELGLSPGIPVVGGAGDTAAAAIGAGAITPETLLLTLSSGAQALAPVMTPHIDSAGRIHTFCSAFPPDSAVAGWYLMGATLAAGLALRWLRQDLFQLPVGGNYHDLDQAAALPVGANGLLFLPYLRGERTPHLNANARGLFFGLSADHDRIALTRAVLEGVAMALYDAWLVVRETGAAPERIILAGGGARSQLWRQIIADLFGLPLLPLVISEQSAFGAAILAGAALGINPAEVAPAWSATGDAITPDPVNHRQYQELHALFRNLYTANSHLFDRVQAFRQSPSFA